MAVLEEDHPIGEANRREAVGDDQCRPISHQFDERVVDPLFDLDVDRAGRVVEDEDRRVEEQCPRDREPLSLAS